MSRHPVFAAIDREFPQHLQMLQEMIRQPSVSAEGNGIREMAVQLRDRIRALGASCELAETGGNPVVYGCLDAGAPRTVLFYELYDVQPAGEPGWIAPPFAGEVVDLPGHGPSVVGRGAFNSKGCIAGFLGALAAFQAAGVRPPVNVIFMVEGEEEIGSPNLPAFIRQHARELKRADCLFQPYFGENAAGKTIIYGGFKGLLYLELTCEGGDWGGPAEREIHAMHNAWIANPAWRLVQALGSMKGPGEATVVEGFYDQVRRPTPDEQALLDHLALTFDSATPLREQGARRYRWDLEGVELLGKYLYEPSLNLDGIGGGYQGDGTKTVIPQRAQAKVDIRLVPDMDPETTLAVLRRHLDRHGYADIAIRVHWAYPPSQTSPSSPAMQALVRSSKAWAPGAVEVWPRSAGAAPHYLFTQELGLPVAFGGLGHGGRSHSANEYVTVEGLRRHVQGIAAFLLEFAESR